MWQNLIFTQPARSLISIRSASTPSDVSLETKQLPLGKAEAQSLNADIDYRDTKQAHELVEDEHSHGDDVGPSFRNTKLNDLLKGALFESVEKGVYLLIGEGVVVHLQGVEVFQPLVDCWARVPKDCTILLKATEKSWTASFDIIIPHYTD